VEGRLPNLCTNTSRAVGEKCSWVCSVYMNAIPGSCGTACMALWGGVAGVQSWWVWNSNAQHLLIARLHKAGATLCGRWLFGC